MSLSKVLGPRGGAVCAVWIHFLSVTSLLSAPELDELMICVWTFATYIPYYRVTGATIYILLNHILLAPKPIDGIYIERSKRFKFYVSGHDITGVLYLKSSTMY